MNKYITIYFDTYFYVWLANATDKEANEIIAEVNKLKIRHVLSGQIILELLSSHTKPDKDKILVSRISKFEIEPYRISSNIFNEIDLLQLDSAQTNLIKNKGKELHRLVELNLDNRCFCSNSLKNTVEVIKEKNKKFHFSFLCAE